MKGVFNCAYFTVENQQMFEVLGEQQGLFDNRQHQ